MNTKLNRLILLNAILLLFLILSLNMPRRSDSTTTNHFLFSLRDISAIDRLLIGSVVLEKQQNGQWIVNNKYAVEPAKIRLLLEAMQNIEVKKNVPQSLVTYADEKLSLAASTVQAYSGSTLIKSYQIFGDKQDTYARIADKGGSYIVHLPGYFGDFYQLYVVDEWEWRNKVVLRTEWRTLKRLSVDYHQDEENSFAIIFNGDFHTVARVIQLDSAKVYDYVSLYGYFKALSFLRDSELVKDSLKVNAPLICTINLEDLYPDRNDTLSIYPGYTFFYGVSNKTGEVATLSKNLMRRVLVNRNYFMRK